MSRYHKALQGQAGKVSIHMHIARDTTLKSLIGLESHGPFKALNANTDWLSKPVHMWPSDPNFLRGEQFVRSVNVVNGAVEGGVKLISDFPTIMSTDAQQRS